MKIDLVHSAMNLPIWLAATAVMATIGFFFYMRARARRKASQQKLQRSKIDLEEKLNVSQVKYESLVNTIDGIVWEANIGSPGFVFVSPQAEKIIGYPCNRWIYEPRFWQSILHPEDLARITGDRYLSPDQKRDTRLEYRILTADGRTLWMSDHIKIIEEVGQVKKMRGVMIDISDRKRAEAELATAQNKALEAARVKSDFLANMSHEIRTPLNAIVGMSSLALEYEMSEDVKDCMTTVKTAADSLLMLINDILDFSKIEAGKIELENSDFRLKSLCRNAIDVIDPLARQKGVHLSFHLHANIPEFIRGDSGRILQVLMNMLSNAVKFTGHGGYVRLSIERTKGGKNLRFSVADNGVGISEEAIAKLFQPFTQADTTMSRKYGGTGLGLSICKRLVHLMEGKIGVDSKPSCGSTFWFELTIQECEQENLSLPEEEDPPLEEEKIDARVLVVDDNPANLKLMKIFLSRLGFKPELVANGNEAITAYRSGAFNLILMDCQMPELDGYDATKVIRSIEAESGQERIPILALTAHAMSGDKEKCLAAGMDDYLSKPISIRDLRLALRKWLAKERKNKMNVNTRQRFPDCDIDFDYLRGLEDLNIEGQPDLASELIEFFLQNAPQKIATIEAAMTSDNLVTIQREAHSLKSTCHNVGARRLAMLCAQIEESEKLDAARGPLQDLQQNFLRIAELLKNYRQERKAS